MNIIFYGICGWRVRFGSRRAWPVSSFQSPRQSLTQPVKFEPHTMSVPPDLQGFHFTSRLPGVVRERFKPFSISLALCRCIPCSTRLRGCNVLVRPLPAVVLGSLLLSTFGVRSAVCYLHYTVLRYRSAVWVMNFLDMLCLRYVEPQQLPKEIHSMYSQRQTTSKYSAHAGRKMEPI